MSKRSGQYTSKQMREYLRRRRATFRARGLCTCGRVRDREGKQCQKCLLQRREWNKKREEKVQMHKVDHDLLNLLMDMGRDITEKIANGEGMEFLETTLLEVGKAMTVVGASMMASSLKVKEPAKLAQPAIDLLRQVGQTFVSIN